MANRIFYTPISRYFGNILLRGRHNKKSIPSNALIDNDGVLLLDNDGQLLLDNV